MNKEKIRDKVIEWASRRLGPSFTFREYQLDAIIDVIYDVLDESTPKGNCHVIEAPTGSGKSLINIISSGVLSEYYGKKSYILCSDLYLYSQYEDAISKYKLDYGMLKGQTGNYVCTRNHLDVRNGDCRIAKMSWSKLSAPSGQKEFPCARHCQYIKDRQKAISSPVTLMTYQLYFYMIDVVAKQTGEDSKAPFKQRDVIFCDECHNIPSLVQSQFSPAIRRVDMMKFADILQSNFRLHTGLFADDTVADDLRKRWADAGVMKAEFDKYWAVFTDTNASHEDEAQAIYDYIGFVRCFLKTIEAIEDALCIKKTSQLKLTKDDYNIYKTASWYRNYVCFLSDFSTAIQDCGPEYLVKQVSVAADETKEVTVSFSCAKEDYMCYKYLLSTSKKQVLTSATVGLKEAFDENLGLRFTDAKESTLVKIPSTFDFTNSPVIASTRWKMSYDSKDYVLPKIAESIYEVMRRFKGFHGIIQTGSYANTKYIYEHAPSDLRMRMLTYYNSKEKQNILTQHRYTKDSVIIGPTLVEGVDLPDDMCRFIIIAKVPYPSLGDKLVQAKMKLFPHWYKSEAATGIIQGIGRGNRSPSDWCVTYILDACFANLYMTNKSQFPKELQERIKLI